MSNVQTRPSRMFNLEGTLIGFLGDDARHPKSIALDVDQEQLAVQLPKELRASAQSYLKPGDRVRCVGCTRVDFKAGIIKLKAYQIFLESPCAFESPTPSCQATTSTVSQTPSAKSAKPAKIMICHKSGCQKRGGRKVVAALEAALQDHQLTDQVEIHYTGCQKRCSKAPSLTIMPGKHRYDSLNVKNVSALVEEHFCQF
jgi:(2Fe-2S) ferredoxin